MKRIFLKNSLAAFAFSLAIIASFAFSSNQSDYKLIDGYIQSFLPKKACNELTDLVDCGMEGIICTFNGMPIYQYKNLTAGTSCFFLLYKHY